MKKFRFSLEQILEYRRQLESARLSAYGRAAMALRQRQAELEQLGRELAEYRARMAQRGIGKISAAELALYRSYLGHCEVKVSEAAEWMMHAARDVEEQRRELVKARREKRVIERLKDIRRGQYDYEAAREETAQLDEVAATRFIARRSAAGDPR